MIVPSYHYMIGPAAALLALGVIVLLCRWVFSTSHRDERTARARRLEQSRGDFGLLVPVAGARSPAEAEALRARLREAGIRSTLASDPATAERPAGWQVMVFRVDAERAGTLVR